MNSNKPKPAIQWAISYFYWEQRTGTRLLSINGPFTSFNTNILHYKFWVPLRILHTLKASHWNKIQDGYNAFHSLSEQNALGKGGGNETKKHSRAHP